MNSHDRNANGAPQLGKVDIKRYHDTVAVQQVGNNDRHYSSDHCKSTQLQYDAVSGTGTGDSKYKNAGLQEDFMRENGDGSKKFHIRVTTKKEILENCLFWLQRLRTEVSGCDEESNNRRGVAFPETTLAMNGLMAGGDGDTAEDKIHVHTNNAFRGEERELLQSMGDTAEEKGYKHTKNDWMSHNENDRPLREISSITPRTERQGHKIIRFRKKSTIVGQCKAWLKRVCTHDQRIDKGESVRATLNSTAFKRDHNATSCIRDPTIHNAADAKNADAIEANNLERVGYDPRPADGVRNTNTDSIQKMRNEASRLKPSLECNKPHKSNDETSPPKVKRRRKRRRRFVFHVASIPLYSADQLVSLGKTWKRDPRLRLIEKLYNVRIRLVKGNTCRYKGVDTSKFVIRYFRPQNVIRALNEMEKFYPSLLKYAMFSQAVRNISSYTWSSSRGPFVFPSRRKVNPCMDATSKERKVLNNAIK